MLWRAILYSVQEGLLALWRTKLVSLLSVGTIAISFAVLGLFLLVGVNVGALTEGYGDGPTLHIFLVDEITDEQREALLGRLRGDELVSDVAFVGKQEAAARFRALFPDEAGLLEVLERNPLPASFEVGLRDERRGDAGAVDELVDSLHGLPGVESVRYDRQWVETLDAAAAGITYAGLVLGGLLILAAIVTAANIIKINIMARREEIEIMRLVGAEGVYVRGPFIVGGLVQGLLASVLAVLAMLAVFHAGAAYLGLLRIEMLEGLRLRFLPLWMVALLLAGGLVVGLLASLLSFGRAGRA